MWLVDLDYNFECDWLIELSDNNLASKLVENRSFFKPIAIKEIVIFMIKYRKIPMIIPYSLSLGSETPPSLKWVPLNVKDESPFNNLIISLP